MSTIFLKKTGRWKVDIVQFPVDTIIISKGECNENIPLKLKTD